MLAGYKELDMGSEPIRNRELFWMKKATFSLLETDLLHYAIKKVGFPKNKFNQFFLWLLLEEKGFNWNILYLG